MLVQYVTVVNHRSNQNYRNTHWRIWYLWGACFVKCQNPSQILMIWFIVSAQSMKSPRTEHQRFNTPDFALKLSQTHIFSSCFSFIPSFLWSGSNLLQHHPEQIHTVIWCIVLFGSFYYCGRCQTILRGLPQLDACWQTHTQTLTHTYAWLILAIVITNTK